MFLLDGDHVLIWPLLSSLYLNFFYKSPNLHNLIVHPFKELKSVLKRSTNQMNVLGHHLDIPRMLRVMSI